MIRFGYSRAKLNNFLVESVGTLRDLTIENCTDTTSCKIITKREYNVGGTFVPSKSHLPLLLVKRQLK